MRRFGDNAIVAGFRPRTGRGGFTLVELLVVIGIIGLLVSILLPALASARRAAQAVACAANLHSLCQAMQIYATQYNGWIAGSPWTTGYEMLADGRHTLPAVNDENEIIEMSDWECPLAKIMAIPYEERSDNQFAGAALTRFLQMQAIKSFVCPSNSFLVPEYVGTDSPFGWPVIRMPSYDTALIFLMEHYDGSNPSLGQQEGDAVDYVDVYNLPTGYVPKLNKVGNLSRKIYIADGAKFFRVNSATTTGGPDYDAAPGAIGGGMMSDQGAWSSDSSAWDRYYCPQNNNHTAKSIDPRLLGYRHGKLNAFANGDGGFLMNAGFYDGHVEALGDLESANPSLWMPSGTTVTPISTEVYKDVLKRYFGNRTTAVTIQE